MKRTLTLGLVLLLCSAALAGGPKPAKESKLAQQLRATELAFASSAKAKDFDKFMSFLDDDIKSFHTGAMNVGKDKARETWAPLFQDPNRSIVWSPEVVEASGNLGYTTGPFEVHVKQADGSDSIVLQGRYITIWRRHADGSWKATLDIGSNAPPPQK
ncbi:MAG TPA: nuclear transport factor 2 family protein [Terriglobales bacterium]|jgi:ketosteroid isomerase-like protein|nr:nuclear transport factor 2 family protein [Terriglobales bacterium]